MPHASSYAYNVGLLLQLSCAAGASKHPLGAACLVILGHMVSCYAQDFAPQPALIEAYLCLLSRAASLASAEHCSAAQGAPTLCCASWSSKLVQIAFHFVVIHIRCSQHISFQTTSSESQSNVKHISGYTQHSSLADRNAQQLHHNVMFRLQKNINLLKDTEKSLWVCREGMRASVEAAVRLPSGPHLTLPLVSSDTTRPHWIVPGLS